MNNIMENSCINKDHEEENDHISTNHPLRYWVEKTLDKYLNALAGTEINDVYALVMQEVELGLFKTVMQHTDGNQSKAASMLGIARGTLRTKLLEHGLITNRKKDILRDLKNARIARS